MLFVAATLALSGCGAQDLGPDPRLDVDASEVEAAYAAATAAERESAFVRYSEPLGGLVSDSLFADASDRLRLGYAVCDDIGQGGSWEALADSMAAGMLVLNRDAAHDVQVSEMQALGVVIRASVVLCPEAAASYEAFAAAAGEDGAAV